VTGNNPTILLNDIAMGESARWHEGRFWMSDWVAGEILAVDVEGPSAGRREVVARSSSFPFCFDWLPDGTLVVTGSNGLERVGADGALVAYVDLRDVSAFGWNEVLVAPRGHMYVNNINFDMMGSGMNFEVGSKSGLISLVTPAGDVRQVASGLAFPNGMAVTSDGSTLVVAESFASRLAAFDIDAEGGLSNQRVWAEFEGGADGICIDAEGAIWCATQQGCARVREGGEVLQRVALDLPAFSCALGGPDGTTLYAVANEWNGVENIGKGPRTGRVYTVEVTVPRA
jgi:sugar lactone lactonase YvrE